MNSKSYPIFSNLFLVKGRSLSSTSVFSRVFVIFVLCFSASFANAASVWVSDSPVTGDGNHTIHIDSFLWDDLEDDGWSNFSSTLRKYFIAPGGTLSVLSNNYNISEGLRFFDVTGLVPGTYRYNLKVCAEDDTGEEECFSYDGGTVSVIAPAAVPSTFSVPSSDTNGSYSVSWSAVSTATSYTLQQRTGSGAWATIHTGSATSKSISGRSNNTYSYRVNACNTRGCSGYTSTKTTVVLLPPSSPSTFTVPSSDSNGAYSISWSSVSTATSYTLQEKAGSGSWVTIYSGTARSKSRSGKSNNTYSYQVRACNGSGCSAYSSTKSTTVLFLPSSPTTFTVPSSDSNGAYSVSWSSVSTATSYTLQEKAGSGSWVTIYSGTARSKSRSGKPNNTYSYQVRACNSSGCSAYTSTKTTTVLLPPSSPTTFTVPSSDTNGAYSVSWSTVSTATSYTLQEKVGSGGWVTVQNASSSSRTITGKSNNTYSYQVRACNSSGCSAYTSAKSTTVLFPASSPTTFTVPSSDSNGVYNISWSTVSTATSYTLQEKTGSGSWVTLQNTSSTSRAISGKSNNTYSYQVRACNSSGCSAYTSTKSTVVLFPPSASPGTFTVPSSDTNGAYSISWSAVSTATSYTLQEKVGSGSWVTVQNTSSISRAISGKSNNTYSYQVRACNGSGCSGYTSTKSTVVLLPPPSPGTLSVPSSDIDGAYSISWSAVSTATSYTLQEKVGSGGWVTIQNTSSTSRAISGKPDSTYSYQVSACNGSGCSAFSVIKSVIVQRPAPPEVTVPYSESYESGLGEWTNTSNKVWTRDASGTPSGSTGPGSADAGSYYMYMETSGGHAYAAGDTASLVSPAFNASGAAITFSYHMYGSNMGSLYLEVYVSKQWTTIWSRSGQQHSSNSAAWSEAYVPLAGYSGLVQLRFRGVAAGSYRGDMAIDNIKLFKDVAKPTGMKAEYSSTPRGLKVSWTGAANAQRYELARSVDDGANWNNNYYSGTATQFIDTDIDGHGTVYYKVRSCTTSCSAWTDTPAAQ